MTIQLRAAAGLVSAALLITGCGAGGTAAPRPVPGLTRGVALAEPAADPRPYGAADSAFGLGLLGAWCKAQPGANLVLSPSSLASGLGMAYLGARGGTARAMAAVLHLPAAGSALLAGLRARSAALRRLSGPGVTLAASDQVWSDPSLPPLRSYLDAVATGYGAGLAQVPLLHNPDQAAAAISRAVAATTHGQITNLLPPGSLNGIAWVLTDALYLHAAWATPFDPSRTSPGQFTTAGGQHLSVKFMHGSPQRVDSAGGWTGASLPYRGGKLMMVALLPPAGANGCAMPTARALSAIAGALARRAPGTASGTASQDIALPRLSLRTTADMKPLLSGLGMAGAFTPAADFTGLSRAACCIGLVRHAATLQVGEKGTVAAAATAVGILPTAGRQEVPTLTFDRPFLLLVTAAGTGEPLFLARVANPQAH
jgi:serine protease inhibitor